MKNLIAVTLCTLVLFATLACSFAVSAASGVQLSLTGKVTDPVSGTGSLTLTVNMTQNSGINTLVFDIGYNANTLSLNSVKNGDVFTEANNGSMFDVKEDLNPLRLYFDENSTGNITATGKVVVIKFDIIDDMGSFDITFAVDNESTFASGIDTNPQSIDVIAENNITKTTQHVTTGLPQTIPPTCTEPGRIEKRCTICNKLLSITGNGEALGHDWEVVDEKEASCTENGYTAYSCTRCDAEKTEEITAAGHKPVIETVEPTTEKEGLLKEVCSVCGAVISEKALPRLTDNDKKEDTKPSDNKDYTVSPKTGDEMIIVATLAAISLAGCAVIIKRRKEN